MTADTVTHTIDRVLVSHDRDGSEIALTIHTLTGSMPGPTLALLGPQHGDEWWAVRAMYEILADLKAEPLCGKIILVPVCNPPALRDGTRITQVSSDEPDMNRAWGGTNTWIANQLTDALTKSVVEKADVLVDFHLGPIGSTFGAVCYGIDYPDQHVNDRSKELAIAFGYPVVGAMNVCGGFPGPRSLAGFAGTAFQIPTVLVEIGGAGHGSVIETQWRRETVAGVRNLAITLGLIQGSVTRPDRLMIYTATRRINPRFGGLLIPARDNFVLGEPLAEGDLLAVVRHAQTFELLEELRSPCDGYLMYYASSYLLRPGDWAFGVIVGESTRWVNDD